MKLSSLLAATLLTTASGLAAAQPTADPKFESSTAEEKEAAAIEAAKVTGVVWKANALAGLVLTTGNSEITTLSAGMTALRKSNGNQFQFDAGGAYARSSVYQFTDGNGNGDIDNAGEFTRDSLTTTKAWRAKLRYDRYLSLHNSIYAVASAESDKPAGKELILGGQLGYSRQLVGTDTTTIVAEVGYDFSSENPVVGDTFSIHSARGFLGYSGKLSDDTGLDASIEGLANVASVDVPLLDTGAPGTADAFDDYRLMGRLALTTKLYKDMSFRFGFEARYDNIPNPLGAINGINFADGFLVGAEKLDTKTEASLIINFL